MSTVDENAKLSAAKPAEPPEGRSYVVVLKCRSSVRFPFQRGAELNLGMGDWGDATVRVLTGWKGAGLDHPIPRELFIEVRVRASQIDQALDRARILANAVVPMISFSTNAETGSPEPHVAYEEIARDGRREFIEYFVPDERGLVPPSREADPDVVSETALALITSGHGKAVATAISHYHSALSHYHLGGEALAVEHLWMSAEALREGTLSEYLETAGTTEARIMEAEGHENRHHLLAWVRRELIFQGDLEVYGPARDASEGMEHGHYTVGEVRAKAEPVCDASFRYVREAIVALLNVSDTTRDELLGRFGAPADTQSLRRRIEGHLVGEADELAAPGYTHPVLEWNSSVAHFGIEDDGQPQVRFRDRITVRTSDSISFQAGAFGLYGRPTDGQAIRLDIELESTEEALARDRVLPYVRQLSSAVASLGPGEQGASFKQPLAHLLELFYRSKGLYRACSQLLDGGHPEEALILGRALLRDAVRLQEASESDAATRSALAFGWKHDSLEAINDLLLAWAAASDKEPSHTAMVDDRLNQILKAAGRFGAEEVRAFTPADVLVQEADDEDLPNLDLLAQVIEEGWDISTRSRLRPGSSDQVELHDSAPDSWLYPLAAKFVMSSYLLAAKSAMRPFDWEDTGELARFEQSMEEFEDSHKSDERSEEE